MPPRAHHQRVGRDGAILLQGIEQLQGSGEILGIEPAAHPHHRRRHVLHVRRLRARLPDTRRRCVLDVVVPVGVLVLEIFLVGIGQRTHAQEEIVGVHGAGIEPTAGCGRCGSAFRGRNRSKSGSSRPGETRRCDIRRRHCRHRPWGLAARRPSAPDANSSGRARRRNRDRRSPRCRPFRCCWGRFSPASRWCRRCRCSHRCRSGRRNAACAGARPQTRLPTCSGRAHLHRRR